MLDVNEIIQYCKDLAEDAERRRDDAMPMDPHEEAYQAGREEAFGEIAMYLEGLVTAE